VGNSPPPGSQGIAKNGEEKADKAPKGEQAGARDRRDCGLTAPAPREDGRGRGSGAPTARCYATISICAARGIIELRRIRAAVELWLRRRGGTPRERKVATEQTAGDRTHGVGIFVRR